MWKSVLGNGPVAAGDPMTKGFGEVVEALRRTTVQVIAGHAGRGSGVIWSQSGQIITNAHVVEAPASNVVEVELWDGRRIPAPVVRFNRELDLACLQIDGLSPAPAAIGDSRRLRAGELVLAVGHPLGFTGAASVGVVHQAAQSKWIVSQLRLAPGNSGGPLANANGEVVGINTLVAYGLAYAIPAQAVAAFLGNAATRAA